jgi:uncharacterized protein YgbK (DUF1537 family)
MTGPLIAFYGDDFTGSTDAMEVTAFAGLPTALFLQPPTAERLSRFDDLACVGVAGVSRAQSPDWMDANLPAVFAALAALNPRLLQYKVCSTFDSAPHVGSIGRALELGLAATGAPWASMLVAAPRLRRHQAFGNLFATVDGVGYRLDRHPTMARHPVTPMREADLRLHLAAQTDLPVGLVDVLRLARGEGPAALAEAVSAGARAVLFDAMDETTLTAAGATIWGARGESGLSISSSGLQYALIAHLRATGELPPAAPPPGAGAVDRLFCVSGSCSPATAAQIADARARDWLALRIDPAAAVERGVDDLADQCLTALSRGQDVVAFTAEGPDDPAVGAFEGSHGAAGQAALGAALGALARAVVTGAQLPRIVAAGGDTSGHVARAIGLFALSALAPVAPGAPICRAHADDPALDELEIVLKGGQVGAHDFLETVKAGGG